MDENIKEIILSRSIEYCKKAKNSITVPDIEKITFDLRINGKMVMITYISNLYVKTHRIHFLILKNS